MRSITRDGGGELWWDLTKDLPLLSSRLCYFEDLESQAFIISQNKYEGEAEGQKI